MDPRFANPLRLTRVLTGACLLGTAVFAVTPCLRADSKPVKVKKESRRADAKEIESLETKWREALVHNDSVSMEKLLSDEYFGISSSGTVTDKHQYLHQLDAHQNDFSAIELMDQKVRMQPTTAIVTSQAHVVGQLDGRPVNSVFRYTKVYGREAGAWRVLNFEATRVSGPRPGDTEMHRGMPMAPSPSH